MNVHCPTPFGGRLPKGAGHFQTTTNRTYHNHITMEKNNYNGNPAETRGWDIVRALNTKNNNVKGTPTPNALEARRLLAEYLQLGLPRPSRLHSAILSCAVKMAIAFPDFHFVAFLDLWGLENLRPEDSEPLADGEGRRIPPLAERMAKAYAYSLLFHPDEHLEEELEAVMRPTLRRMGFSLQGEEGPMNPVTPLLATRLTLSEVRGRKMTFVWLLTPEGEELCVEVHTLTAHARMRYEEIEGKRFDALLRLSEKGNLRIEAALPGRGDIAGTFPTAIAYVEYIDTSHHHIHLYDNFSRHLVAPYQRTTLTQGQYVEFVPVIPKEGNFKTAIITRTLPEGAEAFGYREARVTYTDEQQGYAAWELLPDASGEVHGIVEKGTKEPQVPCTQGYLYSKLCKEKQCPLPKKGERIALITFLKRGKDGKKRPMVVDFRPVR